MGPGEGAPAREAERVFARVGLLEEAGHDVTIRRYLSEEPGESEADSIRRFSRTGRPAGDEWLLEQLKTLTVSEVKRR